MQDIVMIRAMDQEKRDPYCFLNQGLVEEECIIMVYRNSCKVVEK